MNFSFQDLILIQAALKGEVLAVQVLAYLYFK